MKERDLILALHQSLSASPAQRSRLFESDAEILELAGQCLALTIDDFSAEDGFPTGDPELLAWNLIMATVSDLFAVGASPLALLNSIIASPEMDADFLARFSTGMNAALQVAGAHMLGGDAGTADAWRFTGVALGTCARPGAPLNRVSSAKAGQVLLSGRLGDGNLAAGVGASGLRFECRREAAAALVTAAAGGAQIACIDTSDGLGVSLANLAAVNDSLRIVIQRQAIPYAAGIAQAAGALDVPPEAFLLGSAGEYELLALWDESAALPPPGFQPIGWFDRSAAHGVYWQRSGERREGLRAEATRQPELPDPRASTSLDEYRADLFACAHAMFGRGRDT